jgi:hypothetical protein
MNTVRFLQNTVLMVTCENGNIKNIPIEFAIYPCKKLIIYNDGYADVTFEYQREWVTAFEVSVKILEYHPQISEYKEREQIPEDKEQEDASDA